ncbi:hypothetical protein LX32DRAFT_679986 [Colletotrichum zoysiae]|uniref:Uncharacterized protein n=1 Tax=Colletotrichum zoysiae TaxID=1216348 RepID=A0AAD9HQ80_9PEZI|nr:hypothetical protein LX32DRAFT_679986 [Colletotrichum zoysiae]
MASVTDPTAPSSPAASLEDGGRLAPRAGNAVLFSPMTVTCLVGSIVANRFGLKATFRFRYRRPRRLLGGPVRQQPLRLGHLRRHGGALLGRRGGCHAQIPGAGEPGQVCLAYRLCYRNSGSILSGVINLAFNYRGRSTGKLDSGTYIVSVVLHEMPRATCRPAPLPSPEKVIRRNGSPPSRSSSASLTRPNWENSGRLMLRKEFLVV